MSADTTIAVFRFNDGKCRVGLVQAIENFTGFQWGKSATASATLRCWATAPAAPCKWP